MRNKLVLVTLVAVLLGAMVTVPSCGQGGLIAELEATIAGLETTISGQNSTIAELEAQAIEQDSTINNLEAEKEAWLSQAQELYIFATQGLAIWEVAFVSVSDAFRIVLGTLEGNSADVDRLVGDIGDALYDLERLFAPSNALHIKRSLFDQLDLALIHVGYISIAIDYKEQGDVSNYNYYWLLATNGLENVGYWDFQQDVKRELINLRLEAENDLQ